MKTQILRALGPQERAIAVRRAVALLRAGKPVALPTETVYGLAADALNVSAVLKIFAAKTRPRFDPLIVHLPGRAWLNQVASVEGAALLVVERLIAEFWPGPLTLVLPRRDIVPDAVTAGLRTVAVRISAHGVFRDVIRAFGKPLAAPSANRFGRISPTAAEHVRDELGGRIPLIVDAGLTNHGLESTIVAVRGSRLFVLRRGPITAEQLQRVAPVSFARPGKRVQAPGQLTTHYAPRTPLRLVRRADATKLTKGKRYALLRWAAEDTTRFAEVRDLSARHSLTEAAANLFGALRELDASGVDTIIAEHVPDEELGTAIMDRLRRAAAR